MKTKLIDVSPTRKEIRIEVEPEVVREAFDRISDRFAKQMNVPGFRRGHAPRADRVRHRRACGERTPYGDRAAHGGHALQHARYRSGDHHRGHGSR